MGKKEILVVVVAFLYVSVGTNAMLGEDVKDLMQMGGDVVTGEDVMIGEDLMQLREDAMAEDVMTGENLMQIREDVMAEDVMMGEDVDSGRDLMKNPSYAHFFNGSYEVRDVLRELLNNKSLTSSLTNKRVKRGDCSYSRLYGGQGGRFFRDPCSPNNIGGIIVRSGGIIDSFQVIYTNNNDQQWVPTKHGGSGGKKRMVYFGENEYMIAVVGSYGRTIWCKNCINELGFITENKDGMQIMHGPYGLKRGHLLMFVGQVGGFFGRSGQYLDSIGCYYK